jgi:hypothetical protein
MTDSVTTTRRPVPLDKPPAIANSMMKWALHTPPFEHWVGKEVAVLTFTGRRTGKTYTTPVSYHREGDLVTLVTKRQRTWWHNFETPAEVEIRLDGVDYVGKAEASLDDSETLEFMMGYLKKRPIDAKAFGVIEHKGDAIVEDKIVGILPDIVLIRITLQ